MPSRQSAKGSDGLGLATTGAGGDISCLSRVSSAALQVDAPTEAAMIRLRWLYGNPVSSLQLMKASCVARKSRWLVGSLSTIPSAIKTVTTSLLNMKVSLPINRRKYCPVCPPSLLPFFFR